MRENVLIEFDEKPIAHNKFYLPAIALLCIFIILGALDMIIDFERLTWKIFYFNWLAVLMLFVIPGTGLILTIIKTKTGRFISTLYFSFISLLAIFAIIKGVIQNDNNIIEVILKRRQIVIMTITILTSIFFNTKSFRASFQISQLLWIVTILISLCLAIMLIIFG